MVTKYCLFCGNPILSPDRRRKYCSDKCYEEAHRIQCRENFRRRYADPVKHEQELARYKRYDREVRVRPPKTAKK